VLYRDIEIIQRDGRPCGGGVAAALRDRLATLPPQYVPADVAAGGDSVVVTWPARAAGQPGQCRPGDLLITPSEDPTHGMIHCP